MVRSRSRFPKPGEFVVGRAVDVYDQYVYVDLLDYEGLPSEKHARGMIHITEISSRWVKNIRNHVKPNQRIVVRVLRVDPHKGHIDLSLKKVNSAQRKNKEKEWKYAVKFENLLQFLTEETGISMDEAYEEIGFPVLDIFNDYYQETIEELKENGEEVLESIEGVSQEIKDAFLKIVDENVKISTVSIVGKIKLSVRESDGVETLKQALIKAKKVIENPKETRNLSIHYIAAPLYRIEIISKDYLDAENILSDAIEVIEGSIEGHEATFEFIRD